jgi:hypothetical protein
LRQITASTVGNEQLPETAVHETAFFGRIQFDYRPI